MNGIVAVTCVLGAVLVAALSADVGKERAKTMAECYKAAQVNTNIKCEVDHE